MLKPRQCLYCGKSFLGRSNRSNYCSESHRQMYFRNGNKPRKGVIPVTNPVYENVEKTKPEGSLISCQNCGTPFKKKRVTNMFCTPSCRIIYNNNLKPRKNKVHLTKIAITCEYCGTDFETYKHNERFCCQAHLRRFSNSGYHKDGVTKDQTFDDVIFDDTTINTKVIYANCEFIDCNFESTKWNMVRFVNCMFTDCFFADAQLYGVSFLDCGFYGVNDFTGCVVRKLKLDPEPNKDNFIRDGWVV